MNTVSNVQRLVFHKISIDAIPAGGGFADGIAFFTDPDKRRRITADAQEWVTQAIKIIRDAKEPNPWSESSDEAIAGELLRRIDERKLAKPAGAAGRGA